MQLTAVQENSAAILPIEVVSREGLSGLEQQRKSKASGLEVAHEPPPTFEALPLTVSPM